MKKLLHILLPLLCCIIVNPSVLANNKTYYGKVNASVASTGGGKVYVSTSSELPSSEQYAATSSAVGTAEGGSSSSSANVSFYLFAQPEKGMKLDHWEKDNATVTASTSPYLLAASSTTEGSPTVHDLTAVFSKLEGVMVSTEQPGWGTVTINKADNKIGDAVTLTASPTKVPSYACANLVVKFKGWYDEDGNLLSTEPKYSFTVEKAMSIKGVFENKSTVVSGGYYRVRSSFNRVMTVDGEYTISGTDNDLTGLLSWTLPTGYVAADFNGKIFNNDTEPMEVETMPSTIIQLKGTPNGDGLTEAIGYCQGTDTKTLTDRTFTVQHSSGMPSYYEILSGSYSLKHGNTNPSGGAIVMVGKQAQNAYQFMAVQPINENTVDDFWFGVHPEEAMEYDGGYWASMYTSFPYRCYEPDGVEAYYVKECAVRDGVNYAQLVKIESGIVPAATAVLLKCRGFESSKQNRLIPLDPDAVEIAPIEGNILAGEYQLNKSANSPDHVLFDAATMRVLGLDSEGLVGFYSLEGTPELERNKVYLDLTKIPASARNLPVRLEAASGADEGASAEPSIEGYFRVQSKALAAADGGYIQITGPFTARPDQNFGNAATEAGSVIYVKAYPETVNGKVCHRVVNLRSQGIEICGGIDTDYMAKFSDIIANTTGTASVFEELMWSMVRQGFADGYTSVARVAIEAMITIVATRLEAEPGVAAGELEAFAKRFATEVADKINLSFYLEGNETDGFRIFYDVPNLQCVSDWYLKDENKETFEKGMAAMRAYLTAKDGIATGENFDPAEIAEMQAWGYDITAKYTPGADGIIASSYEQIFADPDLLFNWLKLNMIKFMDPERCPKITLRGYYLPDIATELRKHQLSNMLIGYFPDIMPDRRYFITNGKGAGSEGILDFSNEQHADEMGDYSRWLLKPVTAEDDAYLCFPSQAEDADGYYAAVYTDFPMKAENPEETRFYVLPSETKTATVKGNEITYYELEPFETDVVPARTPVLIEMTSYDHTAHRIIPDYELVWNLAEAPVSPAAIPVSDNATTIQRVAPRVAQEPEFRGVLLDTPISAAGFALQWNMQYSETDTPVHMLTTAAKANTVSGCWFAKQTSGTLPANTAVLMKPTTSLESYKIKEPKPAVPTSIEAIDAADSAKEAVVYDLEGRRVLNPRSGKIYIIDGKKVLLK